MCPPPDPRSALVVYYSHGGKTASIGQRIARNLAADVEAIVDLHQRRVPVHLLASGFRALSARMTSIRDAKLDPADYCLVIVGTPVHAGSLSSPVRAYLHRYGPRLKRTAFFLTSAMSADHSALFDTMAEVAAVNPVSTLAVSRGQLGHESTQERIKAFCDDLKY